LNISFDFCKYAKNFDSNETSSPREIYFFDNDKLILVYDKKINGLYIGDYMLDEMIEIMDEIGDENFLNIIEEYLQDINFCVPNIIFDRFYNPYDDDIKKHFNK